MNLESVFKSLYKICFLIFLSCIALTIVVYNVMPHFTQVSVLDEHCYSISGDVLPLVYIECGSKVIFGKVISFVLNWTLLVLEVSFFPIVILLLPPIFIPFVLFFYLFVLSYIVTKIRDQRWGTPPQGGSQTYYKCLRTIFIGLLVIAIPVQVHMSYKIHLVNSIYWKAKLGIISDVVDRDKDYKRALWTAVSRDELSIVKLLFQHGYSENSKLLESAVANDNDEIVDFYLDNDVVVSLQAVEMVYRRIISDNLCDDVNSEDYKVLRRLLAKSNKPDGELMKMATISLCVPIMQELLKAGGDLDYQPAYKDPKPKTLVDFARVEVKSNNGYNGWLHGKSEEEIAIRRSQMIKLVSKYPAP